MIYNIKYDKNDVVKKRTKNGLNEVTRCLIRYFFGVDIPTDSTGVRNGKTVGIDFLDSGYRKRTLSEAIGFDMVWVSRQFVYIIEH